MTDRDIANGGGREKGVVGGSHPLLKRAVRRYCRNHGLAHGELSHGWVLRVGEGGKARFFHGFDLGLNTRLAAKAADDKYFTALLLTEAGVPHVPRHLLLSPDLAERLGQSEGDWRRAMRSALMEMSLAGQGGSVVLKPNEGRGGQDVLICAHVGEAEKRLSDLFARHETLCVEPYLPCRRECRFVLLADEVLLAFAKVVDAAENTGAGQHGPLLHNLSRDGHIEALSTEERGLAALARDAARTLGLRFCTVDVLPLTTGPLVLEANANVTLARAAEYFGEERILQVYEAAIARALAGA